ncbi:MAG: lipopolysaccharide transport periplasmic protein LptA [Sedimenticolaceae bacterium]|jgi:lipopolysaccharide export system protein LptA
MYRANPLFALLLALVSGTAFALDSDSMQPIELAADSVDFNEAKGLSIYKGDVDLRQGSIRLRGDLVTVYQDGLDPKKVVAEGRPVKFEQRIDKGQVKGEALRVEYEVNSENIILIGDAVLTQGKDSMRSDRIVYDRINSVVKAGAAAKGKQRVRITIQPPGK